MNLELELLRRGRALEQLRHILSEEEAAQEALSRTIDQEVGTLRSELERLKAEVDRLDYRLQRLMYARESLSDEELDQAEDAGRAEEAAWWAEWRHRRAERSQLRGELVHQNGHGDIALRQIYRALARLVHPDLAKDSADRAKREAVMRLANTAREAGDVEQLRRLLAIWARPEEGERPKDVDALRARLAQRRVEIGEMRRQLNERRRTLLGGLLRQGDAEVRKYIRTERARLSRDLAMQRLRRRRVLRQLDERRRNLSYLSGE